MSLEGHTHTHTHTHRKVMSESEDAGEGVRGSEAMSE